MNENELSKITVDIFLKVHKSLGPGLFESVYEEVLFFELKKCPLDCARQVEIPVIHENVNMGIGFKADIIVAKKVIIEIKSVETLLPIHKKQLLTYLKLSGLKLGFLVNFNSDFIKNGIVRLVNGL
jgi:GxxExxY protein